MPSHIKRRSQVAWSNDHIMAPHTTIPRIGNSGTSGTRYGLGALGCVWRSTMTPTQTITNAKSVPIDVIWPNFEIGKNPAKKLIKNMNRMFERHGVLHVGWMS